MFRVIGKIIIFVCGLVFIALGVAEAVYLFAQYIHIFDGLHIALSSIEFVTMIVLGILSILFILKNKKTYFLAIPSIIILGLGIYYLVIHQGNVSSNYYLASGIIDVTLSSLVILSIFWNRKRI